MKKDKNKPPKKSAGSASFHPMSTAVTPSPKSTPAAAVTPSTKSTPAAAVTPSPKSMPVAVTPSPIPQVDAVDEEHNHQVDTGGSHQVDIGGIRIESEREKAVCFRKTRIINAHKARNH